MNQEQDSYPPVYKIKLKPSRRHSSGPGTYLQHMAASVNSAVEMEMDTELMYDLGIHRMYHQCLNSNWYELDSKSLEPQFLKILPLNNGDKIGPYRVQLVSLPTAQGQEYRYRIVRWDPDNDSPSIIIGERPRAVPVGLHEPDRYLFGYLWREESRARQWCQVYCDFWMDGFQAQKDAVDIDSSLEISRKCAIPMDEWWKFYPYTNILRED